MSSRLPMSVTQGEGFSGRVLYVSRAPFISGAERALLSMLRGLDRRQISPLVVLGRGGEMVRLVERLGIQTEVIAMPKRSRAGALGWWRSLRRMRKVMADFNPDLVHANDVPSSQAMSVAAAERGVRRVMHVRWGIGAGDAQWWCRGGAEGVVCISDWVRGEFGAPASTDFRESLVEVIPDAVDWPADIGPRDISASEWEGVNGEAAIGFAGQVIESKGIDLIIEALALIDPARRPRFRVAGEDTQTRGAYLAQLKQLAEKRGVSPWIEWLGFLPDVTELYRKVRAVVCPSRVEPLGLVPLESARYALAALANNVGGFRETIVHGETGWLVDPTPEAWAKALRVVWDANACRAAGLAAHARTRDQHNPALYRERLAAFYGRVMHRPTLDTLRKEKRTPDAPAAGR